MISSEKSKIFKHILNLGCCKKCSLRYLCDKNVNFANVNSYIHENKLLEDDENIETTKKAKPNPCIVCLGVLQEMTVDTILNKLQSSEVLQYDSKVFACSISMPACVILREKAMRWYLEGQFPIYFNDDNYEIPISRVWKIFIKDYFTDKLNKIYENPDYSDFLINVIMDYEFNDEELSVLQQMQPALFEQRKTQHRKFNGGVFSRKGVMAALDRTPSGVFKTHYELPPQIPNGTLTCTRIECKHNSRYIAGRYCKYSRELSQSPWIIDGVKSMETSITEILFEAVQKELKSPENNLVFAASGREDIDVRCLGIGRPFYIEIVDPVLTLYTYDQFRNIEKLVNASKVITICDLQTVSKNDLSHIKEGEESKTKVYNALCVCEKVVTAEHIEKLNAYKTLVLSQKTPIRVLHRRPLAIREKRIFNVHATLVPDKPNLLDLTCETQAGTYVKEFVHGDFGRTKPSIKDILEMNVDIIALDVTAINLDWPKRIDYNSQGNE